MAPTVVRESFHRDGWVYEEKVDGWRMLAYKDGARVASSAETAATTRDASPASQPRSPSCPRAPWYSTARLRSSTSSCGRGSTGLLDSP